MKIVQKIWTAPKGWVLEGSEIEPDLVFIFGDTKALSNEAPMKEIFGWYPKAQILSVSTAGFMHNGDVVDNSILVTAIHFEKTKIQCIETEISALAESFDAGKRLAQEIDKNGLKHVMVFSEGLVVDGSHLVKGLNSILADAGVSVTGGLAGDWPTVEKTFVGLNKQPNGKRIIIIGFYGDDIKIGYGSFGGWDLFGPERIITRSKGNVLYELDGKPALALYKEYLGDKAKDLPLSGLLFPLSLKIQTEGEPDENVTRNLIGINEEDGGLIFAAGDMVEGSTAKLMKGNFNRLIDGASTAANMSLVGIKEAPVEFAILVSCMGRRMVLKDRVAEEIEAVSEVLKGDPIMIGFYSYAEICPVAPLEKTCRLHNQTMTITTFSEQ